MTPAPSRPSADGQCVQVSITDVPGSQALLSFAMKRYMSAKATQKISKRALAAGDCCITGDLTDTLETRTDSFDD